MSARRLPATIAALLLTSGGVLGSATVLAPPASANHTGKGAERHALGLAAPAARSAGRHAWGGWIGSWLTPDGQTVYHLDPQARRGRARYGPAGSVATLTYGRVAVPAGDAQLAAWILSKYGAVPQRSQDAAVELAIDDLLVGGRYGLGGSITRKRLGRLDGPTRGGVLRLAGQMIAAARDQAGPYAVHLAKAGATTTTATPVTVTVTDPAGRPVSASQVAVTTSGGSTITGVVGPDGSATLAVPRTTATQQLTATVSVPDTTLVVRAPTRRRLSRAAVAGVRASVSATAALAPATSWTLTSEQWVQTAAASDTRTYQTLYSGTFQDSWTCSIPKGSTYCVDPAGVSCSHNVPLNSGSWTDYPSVPPDGYRAGNTCVWRHYTLTSSRVVQTGGSYTPAQYGWRPATSTYADATQAANALSACQGATQTQRSCGLSDNATLS